MARVGLFGGTFNPIHVGHLVVAHEARRAHDLDAVMVIPNQVPPHRQQETSRASGRDRFAMVCLAAGGQPALIPSSVELDRDEVSYTVHTVERLIANHPDDRFTFITGADSLSKDTWYRLHDLLGMLEHFVVATRRGYSADTLRERLGQEGVGHLERIAPLAMPAIDVSSTEIRRRAQAGVSIAGLVPALVEDYIRKMGLYR